MMAKKMWNLIPVLLACSVIGLATAAQPAPAGAAKAADAKMKAVATKKAKAAEAQAKAEDRAVANFKNQKGMGGGAMAKK